MVSQQTEQRRERKRERKRQLGLIQGWDERDYLLWSEIMDLPHYGLIADNQDNPMISRRQVIARIEKLARTRFDKEWSDRLKKAATND